MLTRAAPALGRLVHATQCASCHGGKLEDHADWRRRKPNGKLPALGYLKST